VKGVLGDEAKNLGAEGVVREFWSNPLDLSFDVGDRVQREVSVKRDKVD
jgi:hypothetical protein